MSQYDFFNAVRANTIMQGVYDPRLNPTPLVWDKRIPSVTAYNDEIMARFEGFALAADLIVEDAAANVYSFGKFQFESYRVPKLKVGIGLNESQLTQLRRIQQGLATRDETGVFSDWERRIIMQARYGVDVRREALLIAMLFDGLTYNRFGINFQAPNGTNVTWGTYSDLKVTVGTAWDNTGATPVNDVWGVKLVAQARYGVVYDRMTMSTTGFRNMIATTEFQNKARQYLAPNVSYVNLTLTNIEQQKTLAQNVIGMEIELDDRRFWTQDVNGVTTSAPLHPTAGVILSSKANDGNAQAWDFANGEIMEKVVSDIAGTMAPPVAAGYGPTVYPTLGNSQVNPPALTMWGVQRGFPRKHMLQANAVLTIGTFSDSISTALPF